MVICLNFFMIICRFRYQIYVIMLFLSFFQMNKPYFSYIRTNGGNFFPPYYLQIFTFINQAPQAIKTIR